MTVKLMRFDPSTGDKKADDATNVVPRDFVIVKDGGTVGEDCDYTTIDAACVTGNRTILAKAGTFASEPSDTVTNDQVGCVILLEAGVTVEAKVILKTENYIGIMGHGATSYINGGAVGHAVDVESGVDSGFVRNIRVSTSGAYRGVNFAGSNGFIDGVTVTASGDSGIYASTGCKVANCLVYNATAEAYYFSAGVIASNNKVLDAGTIGIRLSGTKACLSNNYVNSAPTGVQFDAGADYCSLVGGSIDNATTGVVLVSGSDNNKVVCVAMGGTVGTDYSDSGSGNTIITSPLDATAFDAQTILAATTDDTPAALTVAEQTLVGRITSGNIAALTATQVRTLINVANGAIAAAGVTYENLSANSDIGTGATQVSQGDHTHSGYAAYSDARFKVGSFTRDMSLANGTQDITGLGFTPKLIIFLGQSASYNLSWGFDNGADHCSILQGANGNCFTNTTRSIHVGSGSSNTYRGYVSATASGQFTVSWERYGTPTGIATTFYVALR